MRLDLPLHKLEDYTSGAQRARVVTEPWAEENLYCPGCASRRLHSFKANTPAKDYRCPSCEEIFQLKSQKKPFATRIQDAAYSKMCEAIEQDEIPNFFALHYDPERWRVRNLTLIPRFAISLSAIEKRNPLSPSAERHGWVGCNILLEFVPAEARISVIANGIPVKPALVRKQFERLRPFKGMGVKVRGWTLDVLNVVRSLGKIEFTVEEVHAAKHLFERLHPANRHVRHKVRQQLQILCALRFIERIAPGRYRLT